MFDSIRETIDYSVENNISFADMMINDEMEREGKSREEVRDLMRQNLNVMREAVEKGTTGDGVESVQVIQVMMLLNFEITSRIIMHYQVMK